MSICLGAGPRVTIVDLFKCVHLWRPLPLPPLRLAQTCTLVAYTSIGARAVDLRLKGLFANNLLKSVADPGFPRGGGANSPGGGGVPTYDFANFPQKLHEIERIWTLGGGMGGGACAPLDPPLKVLRPVFQWINGLNITFAIIFCNLPLQYLFAIDFCLKVFSFSCQNVKSTI